MNRVVLWQLAAGDTGVGPKTAFAVLSRLAFRPGLSERLFRHHEDAQADFLGVGTLFSLAAFASASVGSLQLALLSLFCEAAQEVRTIIRRLRLL